MKKLILTHVTKNFEGWTNLWMLASLASQIQILSFGFASARIGIFPIRSLRSLIGKILSIPSQFFVTWVKIRYFSVLCKLLLVFHRKFRSRFCICNSAFRKLAFRVPHAPPLSEKKIMGVFFNALSKTQFGIVLWSHLCVVVASQSLYLDKKWRKKVNFPWIY